MWLRPSNPPCDAFPYPNVFVEEDAELKQSVAIGAFLTLLRRSSYPVVLPPCHKSNPVILLLVVFSCACRAFVGLRL